MDGMILFDKPAGMTSHDVVASVRRQFERGTKVGHAGTLDPFATGLLLVLVGRATRAQRFLMELPKAYETTARFGATSTTGDPEGEITETGVIPDGDLVLPTGLIRQRPPVYSAVKIGGVRAYDRARRGEQVEIAEREVTVHAFEETGRDGAHRSFSIRCSSGTYIRSLIADLGDAYCEQLRRTEIGDFRVTDADPDRVVGLADALAFLPQRHLEGEHARHAFHGRAIPGEADGPTLLTDDQGVIAIAEPRTTDGTAMLKPIVGLRG
jgi:tRNA pseudouridine55 synthase